MKTTGKEQQLIVGMGDDGGELGSDLAMLSPRSSTSKEVSRIGDKDNCFLIKIYLIGVIEH